MTVIFIALALICYLAFLIDWKELRGVLSQGGWGAICLYVICAAWVTPTVVAATEIGH
jgi:hypothetical protein